MSKNVLTDKLSEPLSDAKTARINIHTGDGNFMIDRLIGGEQVLVTGTLQYFESQGVPIRTLDSSVGRATFTLKGGTSVKPWFRFPWSTCNGATDWQIHLNPTVSSDITAHSGGGNVKLDLTGMAVTRLYADTGGGNMDVVLPDNASNLYVLAKTGAGNIRIAIGCGITESNMIEARSGAGNVDVHIPSGVATRIHATTGLGKTIVDPQFNPCDNDTYESPDFDRAANKVEITVHSGAGNVSVKSKQDLAQGVSS
jgi:hypothetical protein